MYGESNLARNSLKFCSRISRFHFCDEQFHGSGDVLGWVGVGWGGVGDEVVGDEVRNNGNERKFPWVLGRIYVDFAREKVQGER